MQILQIETSAEPVLANHAAETAEFAQKDYNININ